jgi:hypothetical protein
MPGFIHTDNEKSEDRETGLFFLEIMLDVIPEFCDKQLSATKGTANEPQF